MDIKPLITWDNKLSVDIQEIDEQHKLLVSLVNQLYESIVRNDEEEVIHSILNQLVQYTVIHFAVEESLMRIFHYPQYETHKSHHEDLTRQVYEIQERIQKGEKVSMDLLNFLRKWLTNHIMLEDKEYSPYLLSKGLQSNWSSEHSKSFVGKVWSFMHHR